MNAYAAGGSGARLIAPDLGGGTNQAAGRLHNERLILSLIRLHKSLPKAEIARMTGLSAQTVSVIINQLEADGPLRRQSPTRGRVGQPSVPISLDPEGAFSFGLKLGRRSSDLILMDFCGGVRASLRETYSYPTPRRLLSFQDRGCRSLLSGLSASQARRVRGLGIASPFELWGWESELGAPPEVAESWRGFDIADEIQRQSAWPVHYCNDGSAACAAELTFGRHAHLQDFLYIFVGSFLGGGIVLNGSLFTGRSGNAGALGSLPIPAPCHRLIRSASLHVLERMLRDAGGDPQILWRSSDWSTADDAVEEWIEQAAEPLAIACVAGMAVVDFQAIVIDGAFPESVRLRLIQAVQERFEQQDLQGLTPAVILSGSIGPGARAIGAASLPLVAGWPREPDSAGRERHRQTLAGV
jgi:predicted NBD/HSP70 family sugar kinase